MLNLLSFWQSNERNVAYSSSPSGFKLLNLSVESSEVWFVEVSCCCSWNPSGRSRITFSLTKVCCLWYLYNSTTMFFFLHVPRLVPWYYLSITHLLSGWSNNLKLNLNMEEILHLHWKKIVNKIKFSLKSCQYIS